MAEINEHVPGTFCWVELGTLDSEGAKRFYAALFGWDPVDHPMGPDGFYTMLQIEGKEVAALYQLAEEQRSQGVPPRWQSYVSVASADESAEKAQSLGGKVLMAPFDVFDAGRMAVIEDPTGATFALWQPRKHIGSQIVNRPGTFCWNELNTGDARAASEFYTRLFGWEAKESPAGSTPYTEFLNRGEHVGGMLEMKNVPPHWLVYFAVENCDRAAERAQALGAQTRVAPTDIPGVGRFAVIEDPQGAVFSIIKLTQAL